MKKYFSKNASTNVILLIISYISYPLSLIFEKTPLSANTITLISLFFGILSINFIIFDNNLILFLIFFYFSIILDFCDGQIARMKGTVNKTEFDLDMNVDLLKNCLIFTFIGFFYNEAFYWLCTCLLIFLYTYFIKTHLIISKLQTSKNINNNSKQITIFGYLKIIFLSINAHTFLIIPLMLINLEYAFVVLIYISSLFALHIIKNIIKLNSFKIN
jgi:phosphatidylglycerophosphate synthase